MTKPVWTFAERSENDVEQEVTEVDQFNSETVDLQETLVRESAQNSQDARAGSAPVRIRIGLGSPERTYLAALTRDLEPRVKAAGFEWPEDYEPRAIVVEDFGTKGLTGAVDDHHSEDNYRSFFFRHGGSYKSGAQNGRWGLGKLVFPMSSRARCFFGLTRRAGDAGSLLLGETVLRTHRHNGRKYAPHGHFGRLESGKVLPVTDVDFLEEFSRQFGLARKAEPGLSVVVPWPVQVPDSDHLIAMVARNYLWPILSGSLSVDVMGSVLDQASIRQVAHLLPAGLLDFAESILSADHSSLISLPAPGQRPGGVWVPADELVGEEDKQSLRQLFAAGAVAGFRIPVPLGRKGQDVQAESSIRVFVKKAPEGIRGDALYVRKDITVPDEARRFGKTDVFAAMIADNGDVAEFLADAENPAHTSWSGQAQRLTANWKYPNQTLSFIRNAPVRLYQMLTTGLETEVRNALLDFFWIADPKRAPEPGRKRGQNNNDDGKEKAGGPIDPPPEPASRKFRIDQEESGFSIRGEGALATEGLPRQLRIRVGYDVEGGNGVKEWDRFDFDLGADRSAFLTTTEGAEPEKMDGNEVLLRIDDPEFRFTLTGFDINRDLVVEANLTAGH